MQISWVSVIVYNACKEIIDYTLDTYLNKLFKD